MPLVADRSVAAMSDFVCGANEAGFHLRGVNFGRDCREPDVVADIRNVVAGDPSPDGRGTLAIVRGMADPGSGPHFIRDTPPLNLMACLP